MSGALAFIAGCATTTTARWEVFDYPERAYQIPLPAPVRQESVQLPAEEATPASTPVATPNAVAENLAKAKALLPKETVTDALKAEGMKPVVPPLSLPPLGQSLLQPRRPLYPSNVRVGEVYNSGNIPAQIHTEAQTGVIHVDPGSSVSVGSSSF